MECVEAYSFYLEYFRSYGILDTAVCTLTGFDKIFDTLQTGLSKLGDSSGTQTKAISGLLGLIKDIPMDGKQGCDQNGKSRTGDQDEREN